MGRTLTCSDSWCLKEDSVVDEAYELGGGLALWTLSAEQVQHSSGQVHVLTVLNKLTQVGQP